MVASPWAANDARRRIERSLTISNAGSVLMQTKVNTFIQQIHSRYLGATAVLERKPGSGDKAYVNRRTPGTTGGEWVGDTTAATEETGSYNRASFEYRTLLTKGTVTRKLQATGRSYGDALGNEILGKVGDYTNLLESAMIIGNDGAGGNAYQPNGLLTLVGAVSGQVIANSTNSSGGSVVLSNLDAAIDAVKDSSNRNDLVILTSQLGGRKLNAALQAQQQFINSVDIEGGFRVRAYDGIPIITSSAVPNTLIWNGSAIQAFSGGSTTAYIVVNRRYAWIEELTPMTFAPLPRTTTQYDSFEIFWDGTLVLGNTLGAAIVGGISGS